MSHRTLSSKALLVVFITALLVRLLFCMCHRFEPQRVCTPDSRVYLELARNLGGEGRFVRGEDFSLENPVEPETFRTPGYPLLVLLCAALPGDGLVLLVLLQILLGSAVAAGGGWIAGRIFSPAAGLLCGLLLAVDAGHVVYANMVMSDILFASLVLAAVLLLLVHRHRPHLGLLAVSGLALTLSAAVRPLGAWLFLVAAVWLLVRKTSRRGVALFCLAALLFPAAWGVRNFSVCGSFSLSSAFHYNVYRVAAAKVLARSAGIPRWQAEKELVDKAVAEAPLRDMPALSRWFLDQALAIFKEHPGHTGAEAMFSFIEMSVAGERRNPLKLLGAGGGEDGVRTISDGRRSTADVVGSLGRAGPGALTLVLVQILFNILVLVFFLDGVRRWFALENRGFGGLLLGVLFYVLLVSLVVASARMRIPVSFILYGFAAYSLTETFTRFGHQLSIPRR
jgi:4-amino-4-deoxy-L-arabinose transferase-like glycosyltransferase